MNAWRVTEDLLVESVVKPLVQNQGRINFCMTCTCTKIIKYTVSLFRPKHPTKVHVWAGISKHGRSGICIFKGIMKKELFVSILEGILLPFIEKVYPEGHKFMMDNDPKHTSGYAA